MMATTRFEQWIGLNALKEGSKSLYVIHRSGDKTHWKRAQISKVLLANQGKSIKDYSTVLY